MTEDEQMKAFIAYMIKCITEAYVEGEVIIRLRLNEQGQIEFKKLD